MLRLLGTFVAKEGEKYNDNYKLNLRFFFTFILNKGDLSSFTLMSMIHLRKSKLKTQNRGKYLIVCGSREDR